MVDRRTFLKGAASLGGAALVGSLAASPSSAALSPIRTSGPRPGTGITDRQWRQLARSLRGTLVLPGQRGYARVAPPYDKRYANVHPAAVVLAGAPEDVATSLRFARHHGIRPIPRSGGHSYGGYSTGTGLVVSLAALKAVSIDASTGRVTIQPGARNEDLYAALPPSGLAIPNGRCPTVGVGGFFLGGGFGFNSRQLGAAVDSLTSTDVVTAEGSTLTATPTSEPDLFWACQGGGGGNFGINTSFELQAHPVSPLAVYELTWDRQHADAAFTAMQEALQSAPDGFSCRIGLDVSGHPPSIGLSVSAIGQLWGSAAELADILAPVLAAAPPTHRVVQDESYAGALKFLEDNVPVGQFTERSGFLPTTPAPDLSTFVSTAATWLERWPGSTNNSAVGLAMFSWGGALGRVAPDATAFVHRDASWLFAIGASWGSKDSPAAVSANLAWLDRMYSALVPFTDGQAYQNFIDPALSDWRSAYYGENFARLVSVKQHYDPDGVFAFAQGIPTHS